MFSGVLTGASLHCWSTSAKYYRDVKTQIPTFWGAFVETYHTAVVRKLSSRALVALGEGNGLTGKWTERLIDFSPLILDVVKKLAPESAKPPLEWVQRHITVVNQVISVVATGVLFAKGQYEIAVPVLAFTVYHVACQKEWVCNRAQVVIDQAVYYTVAVHTLMYSGSILRQADMIVELALGVLFSSWVESLLFKKQNPVALEKVTLDPKSLPELDETTNIIVNKSHIYASDDDPLYQSVLDELAKFRTEVFKIAVASEFDFSKPEDDTVLNMGLLEGAKLAYEGHMKSASELENLPRILKAACRKTVELMIGDVFWGTYRRHMAERLATMLDEQLTHWAAARGIKTTDLQELATLLLLEMGVLTQSEA